MRDISLVRGGSESSRAERVRTFIKKLGPIYAYLLDPDVINIDITSSGRIYIERYGQEAEEAPETFSFDQRAGLVAALATYSGRKSMDEANSRLACDLPAGLIMAGDVAVRGRVQAFFPPMNSGIMIVIRKHAARVFPLDDWVAAGGLSRVQRDFLRWATAEKRNIIVSGEQNAGKSTFCNSLLHEQAAVYPNARAIILQDRDELQPCSSNSEVLYYDVEQIRYVDGRPVEYVCRLQDLLPDALRLRTEALAIGETRDGATTIGLIAAANTGTRGTKTTLHADSAHDVFDRLEELVMMDGKMPVRRAVARLAQVIVHMEIDPRTRKRRVAEILHAQGVEAGEYRAATIAA
jgi:Flp pilus assembly CpaF family ATPase